MEKSFRKGLEEGDLVEIQGWGICKVHKVERRFHSDSELAGLELVDKSIVGKEYASLIHFEKIADPNYTRCDRDKIYKIDEGRCELVHLLERLEEDKKAFERKLRNLLELRTYLE